MPVTESDYQSLKLQIKGLEKIVAELKGDNEAKAKIIAEQAKLIEELKAKLAKYDNPHTPSSAQRYKKNSESKNSSKKRGAPKGHRGATRSTPEPDREVEVTTDQCDLCGSANLEECGVEKQVIEELPPPPKIEVIQFNRHKYKCQDCGHVFIAKDEKCPLKGRFGVDLLVYLILLKFSLRGVLRRIKDFAFHLNSFDITPKGIQDAIFRVGEACKTAYSANIDKVRAATWNYMDETGIRVLGKNYWLWTFRTPDGEVVVVIRPSRGQNVLREIFGGNINGAGVVDGWRAYNIIPVLQRCWAHLIRDVDAFIEQPGGKELSEAIHEKFKALKEFIGTDPSTSMEERKQQKEVWDMEMAELAEQFSKFKELKKQVTYIRNGLGNWYTCLLYPGMEPTNNLSEQVIREHVLVRKIIGTFRSEDGAEYYQYIASVFATWRLQAKDVYAELKKLLVNELCLR
ncbi:Transposase [Methanophagales archaeon]|nr:Transposase [Methanophagales archaeon]